MRSTVIAGICAKSSPACASSRRWWNAKRLNEFMAKKVRIPTPLRKLTNNEEIVEVKAATIGDAIGELQSRYRRRMSPWQARRKGTGRASLLRPTRRSKGGYG